MIYLIIFFGFIFRLISINQSLWLDEATSALVAKMSVADIFSKFLPGDFHPSLYYLFLKGWVALFGMGEVALRIPSVIFGVATIYATYLVAAKLFNRRVGLISSSLMATSGLAVYYSQEARMYSLAAFLVGFLVYLFLEKKWIYFSVILLLLGMTDYVSLFIIPVFWITGWNDRKKLTFSHVPLAVTFIIWLPIFIKQLVVGSAVKTSWLQLLGMATFKNTLLIPVKFMIGRISFDDKTLYAVLVGLISSLFGYLLFRAMKLPNLIVGVSSPSASSGAESLRNETTSLHPRAYVRGISRRGIKDSKLLWAWLITPILIGIIVSLKIPTLSYFRFLFVLPAFYILIAKAIGNLGKHRKLFLCLVLGVNLISTMYYLLTPRFQREDWRGAAYALGADKIEFPAATQKEALIYYGKGEQIINPSQITPKDKEIWLSRYVWEIFDSEDSARQSVESLGYNKTSEYNFNGVVLWRYTK